MSTVCGTCLQMIGSQDIRKLYLTRGREPKIDCMNVWVNSAKLGSASCAYKVNVSFSMSNYSIYDLRVSVREHLKMTLTRLNLVAAINISYIENFNVLIS